MADVQLEHGHVRIANRLYEAMLYAEFSGVQFKILHALIRLTYGWRRKTVTLSHAELSEYIHLKPSGNFRAALNELIAEGVVLQAKAGGPKHSTYAIEKDHVRWGRFSVSSERLERIFGERPASDDDAIVQGDLLRDTRPKQASNHARNGREVSPETGIGTEANSNSHETVALRKDSERQLKDIPSTTTEPNDWTTELVNRLGDEAQRLVWAAEIRAVESGMHGVPMTREQINAACQSYMGNGHMVKPNLNHFRGFLRTARTGPAERPAPPSNEPNDAGKAFAAIRALITTRPNPGRAAVRFIPRQELEKLGERVLSAYEQIGGADRFLSQDEQVGFVLRDFTRAFDAWRKQRDVA